MTRSAATTRRISPYIVAGLVASSSIAWASAQANSVSGKSEAKPPVVEETASMLLRKLRAKPQKDRSRDDRAWIAGLEFCAAIRRADGKAAYKLMDAIGYQPLPLEGDLPEQPQRPTTPSALSNYIDGRPKATPEAVPADYFELQDREALRGAFAAVARWMLPRDFALIIDQPDGTTANWVTRRCCIVIRLRGGEASVIGGNLFDALETKIEKKGDQPPARGAVGAPAGLLARRGHDEIIARLRFSPNRRRITA